MKTPEELIDAFNDEEVLNLATDIARIFVKEFHGKDFNPINLNCALYLLATEFMVQEIGLDNDTLSKMVTQGANNFRKNVN